MRARALGATACLLLLASWAPLASAEFGAYGDDGWPIAVDGTSTNPFPGSIASPDAGPLNEIMGTTVYPYWPILTAEVQRLALEHPDLVKLHSIGKSTIGLDLWMLEIADFGNPDMKPLEAREVVWVDGGTHSNEYSGVYFVGHLASFLLDEYETNETAQWIVENRHTWLMPMVNPDGSNLFGRLNANLVNINRNYPVIWDGQGHDPVMNNRGPSPASELETRHNIEWFNLTRPDYYASVHCCGNLWLYPYGEEGLDPLDNTTLSRVCEEAFPTVRDDCGPIWSTIYPASGSSVDTAYEYTGAVAFGYEMSGRGAVAFWGQPFTMDSVRTQEVESWEGVLHAFLNVHRYGAYPETHGQGAGDDEITVLLANTGYGPMVAGELTLARKDGTAFTMPLPPMGPGENVSVAVPVDDENGRWQIRIEYQKRIAAAPMGERVLGYLAVDRAGQNGVSLRFLGPDAGWEGLEAAQGPAPVALENHAPAPTAPVVVASVAALAGALAVRRRRG